MIVTSLSGRLTAVRDALLSHGWEGDVARLAAGGLDVAAFHATRVDAGVAEAMLPVAARLGLELITGDDWLILVGARSRIGAFARPWLQPEAVRDLATAVGLALPADSERGWRHARGVLGVEHAVIVGVLNVTPDSFSDGGQSLSIDEALRYCDELLAGGAAVIDIGGESTRPGADAVSSETERSRVVPVIDALARRHPSLPLSVDTVHGTTAEAAIAAGACIINDVTAGRHDPSLLEIAARHGAGLVLSHSRGPLGRLASYDAAEYHGDVSGAVARELRVAMHGDRGRRNRGRDRRRSRLRVWQDGRPEPVPAQPARCSGRARAPGPGRRITQAFPRRGDRAAGGRPRPGDCSRMCPGLRARRATVSRARARGGP